MKHAIPVLMFLFIAALAVECTSAEGQKQSGTAAVQLEKAKTETKEAVQASQDYAYTQKTEFVDQMKKDLAEIQKQMDLLSAKVDKSSGAVKADAKTRLDAVRVKWTQAKKQLDQAQSATESTWNDVKDGVKKSYVDVKDSLDKTRQWLSDKIAP